MNGITLAWKQDNISSDITRQIISDDLFSDLQFYLIKPVHLIASLLGVISNVINMLVQYRLGLNTSMGVGVFALSLTDFFITFLDLLMFTCYVISKLLPFHADIDVEGLGTVILPWFRYPGFFISCWITTVLSVEKCEAVVAPLTVRRVFTKKFTTTIIAVIYFIFLSVVFSIYSSIYMQWITVNTTEPNETSREKSYFTVVFTDGERLLEKIIDILCGFVLSVLSHVILITCTGVMVYSLKISSRIRTNYRTSHKCTQHHSSTAGEEVQASLKSNLTSRERKMVKVVLCLDIVLLSCNIPRYVNILAYCAFPGFLCPITKNLSWLLWELNDFFTTVNCSSHFIVYWILNSKFKRSCNNLFKF